MNRLLAGYRKFRAEAFPERKDRFHLLASSQSPEALFITCADSRVVPDLILQAEPGDLFVCRNIGHVIPPADEPASGISASIEYAVEALNIQHVIICGHSGCGAVKAALHPDKGLEKLPHTAQWVRYIEPAWKYMEPNVPNNDAVRHTALIHANVIAQIANLRSYPEVAKRVEQGTIQIHGWYYDIPTGEVEAYDPAQKHFIPLEQYAAGLPAVR